MCNKSKYNIFFLSIIIIAVLLASIGCTWDMCNSISLAGRKGETGTEKERDVSPVAAEGGATQGLHLSLLEYNT